MKKIMSSRNIKIKKGRKSYYYKFFFSFMIVLLMPMITVGLVFMVSHNVVREQILVSSANTLHQFFNRADSVLEEAKDDCVSIALNKDGQLYSKFMLDNFEKGTYYSWKIKQLLLGHLNEKYYDVFIYYFDKDYVISASNGANKLEDYYKFYYEKEGQVFPDEFKEVIYSSEKRPVLRSMNGIQKDSYLCITMRQRISGSEDYDSVVVIVLRPDYIMDLFLDVEGGEQEGVTMIFDKEKEVIYSTGVLEEVHIDTELLENIPYKRRIGEEEYVLRIENSDILNAGYAYAVPEKYFWSKLKSVYTICGVGTFISIVFGIFIAWRQTVKTYRPVGWIVNDLQKQTSSTYNAEENNEFDYIKALFGKVLKEKGHLKDAARRGECAKRNQFIFSVLNGNVQESDDINKIFEENNIHLYSPYFYAIVLGLERNTNMDTDMSSFIISNIYEELFQHECRGYVIYLMHGRYAILVNVKEQDDNEKVISLLETGKGFLGRHFGMELTIGVSSMREGMKGITAAYREALNAYEYSNLLGKGIIINYSDIENREFNYFQITELKMLQMVKEFLEDDSGQEKALSLVEAIMEEYCIDRSASLEMLECFKFETVSMFNKIIKQRGGWSEELKKPVLSILGKKSLEEFKTDFAELLVMLKQEDCRLQEEKNICSKVKKYIEENYHDEQLSRIMLGDVFGISSPYLAKLFKEKYQISMTEYITEIRIKNAKEQLKNTDYSILDIAKNNGFSNSTSFIRSFKKYVDMTPGMYRELTKEEND